jgi:hypothetical protein
LGLGGGENGFIDLDLDLDIDIYLNINITLHIFFGPFPLPK